MIHSMSNPEFKLDVQTPSAAISEIAKGMSDLRDALKAMTELAQGDCPVSALAPHLRQAWSGAAAVSMVCAPVGGDGLGRRAVARHPLRRLTDARPIASECPQSRSRRNAAAHTGCGDAHGFVILSRGDPPVSR